MVATIMGQDVFYEKLMMEPFKGRATQVRWLGMGEMPTINIVLADIAATDQTAEVWTTGIREGEIILTNSRIVGEQVYQFCAPTLGKLRERYFEITENLLTTYDQLGISDIGVWMRQFQVHEPGSTWELQTIFGIAGARRV